MVSFHLVPAPLEVLATECIGGSRPPPDPPRSGDHLKPKGSDLTTFVFYAKGLG